MPRQSRLPRVPTLLCVSLAVAALALTSCSSGGSTPPGKHDKSTGTGGTPTAKKTTAKLKKVKAKKGVANEYATLATGAKISLSAPGAGHAVIAQVEAPKTKTWSKPQTVYKSDDKFCHAIDVAHAGNMVVATVVCGLTAQDKQGTQSSYILATTNGTTWKREDLAGANSKASVSPTGKFAAWSAPKSFVIWSPASGFHSVPFDQDPTEPTVGIMQDTGTLLMVKAETSGKKDCVVTFRTATSTHPTPVTVNSTLPNSQYPKCSMVSAFLRSGDIVANLTTQARVEVNGKKVTKTSPFAWQFAKNSLGHWYIKS